MKENYCFTCGKRRELVGAYCVECNDAWIAEARLRHDSTDLGMRRK